MIRITINRKVIALGLAASLALGVGLTAVQPSAAQGPTDGRFNPTLIGACSTTDYTNVLAQALGISATELRVDLVSGKTLQAVATSKNVPFQTLLDASTAANKADLDQAVKDGLLTQQQADALSTRMATLGQRRGQRPTQEPTEQASQQPTQEPTAQPTQSQPPAGPGTSVIPGARPGFFGGFGGLGRTALLGGIGLGIQGYHSIQPLPIAAQAIGISCADLVKALSQRQTIAQVATSKNVTAQTVIDALVKARTDALAQDVKDALRTQAEADGQSVNLSREYTGLVNGSMGGMTVPLNGAGRGFNSSSNGGFGSRLGNLFNLFRQFFQRGGRSGMPGMPSAPTAMPTQPAA